MFPKFLKFIVGLCAMSLYFTTFVSAQVQSFQDNSQPEVYEENGKVFLMQFPEAYKLYTTSDKTNSPMATGYVPSNEEYEKLATAAIDQYKKYFEIDNPNLELEVDQVEVDEELGITHVRLLQKYQGYFVLGGAIDVHLDTAGNLRSISGEYKNDINADTDIKISEAVASMLALSECDKESATDCEQDFGDIKLKVVKALSNYSNAKDQYYLAYGVILGGKDENNMPFKYMYFVDTVSGRVVLKENMLEQFREEDPNSENKLSVERVVLETDCAGSGYLHKNKISEIGRFLGHYETDPYSGFNPYIVNSRYYNSFLPVSGSDIEYFGVDPIFNRMRQLYRYFLLHVYRNGANGAGGTYKTGQGLPDYNICFPKNHSLAGDKLRCTIFQIADTYCPTKSNRFMNGVASYNGIIQVCGLTYNAFLAGHEYTHTIMNGTSGGSTISSNTYYGSAIKEGCADVGGHGFIKYLKGESIDYWTQWEPEIAEGGIQPSRNPANPHLYGNPARASEMNCGESDGHKLSTVLSHGAYLAAEGTGPEGEYGCHIAPVGIQRLNRILVRSMSDYFTYDETYSQAYSHILAACNDLYPSQTGLQYSPICYQVMKAMRAVQLDQANTCNKTYTEPVCDLCPDDPNKTDPGCNGCGVPDVDSDGDGLPDCADLCPDDPHKTMPERCGCGELEIVEDLDDDGYWGSGSCEAVYKGVDGDVNDNSYDNCELADPEMYKKLGYECEGGGYYRCIGKDIVCVTEESSDCDDSDEILGTECSVGQGYCESFGVYVCDPEKKEIVCGAGEKDPLTINCATFDPHKDLNCDGRLDTPDDMSIVPYGESCSAGSVGKGVCASSSAHHVCSGFFPACVNDFGSEGDTSKKIEITCKNIDTIDKTLDNNCDGKVDSVDDIKGYGEECATGFGICGGTGIKTCRNGRLVCEGEAPDYSKATYEICGNGQDDDCDGVVDESDGCTCQNTGKACSIGECTGRYFCNVFTGETFCKATLTGKDITCENFDPQKDQNCDGKLDTVEDINGYGQTCVGLPTGFGRCANFLGTLTCEGKVAVCHIEPNFKNALPQEICGNGADDDCNGIVDDGCVNSQNNEGSSNAQGSDFGDSKTTDNNESKVTSTPQATSGIKDDEELSCKDSDGGKKKKKFGTVTYKKKTYKDKCTKQKKAVKEYFCAKNGKVKSTIISCGNGFTCKAGVCVRKKKTRAKQK